MCSEKVSSGSSSIAEALFWGLAEEAQLYVRRDLRESPMDCFRRDNHFVLLHPRWTRLSRRRASLNNPAIHISSLPESGRSTNTQLVSPRCIFGEAYFSRDRAMTELSPLYAYACSCPVLNWLVHHFERCLCVWLWIFSSLQLPHHSWSNLLTGQTACSNARAVVK